MDGAEMMMKRIDEWLFGKAIRRAERRERKRIIKLLASDEYIYEYEREYIRQVIEKETNA